MEFDRQLRPATETSWVVSCGGKAIPRWRTAAILKIDISPYLSEKSFDFDEILYTAADFELVERHVIKNEEVALDRLRVRQNVVYVFHASAAYDVRSGFCRPSFCIFFASREYLRISMKFAGGNQSLPGTD